MKVIVEWRNNCLFSLPCACSKYRLLRKRRCWIFNSYTYATFVRKCGLVMYSV